MRRLAVTVSCLCALLPAAGKATTGGPAGEASSITARVVTVTETRERRLADRKGFPASMFNGLRVTLRLEGPAARGAVKVGRLKLADATDDAGTDLRDREQLKWCEQLQDVNRFGQSEDEKAAGVFDYELKLGLAARSATRIKHLKGEIQVLAGGQERVVTLPAVRKLAGTPIADPVLKSAGITLKVDPSPAGKKNTIQAELTGDFDAIREVRVLSRDGSNKLAGSWWSESGGRRSITYMLSEPLEDDAATLEVKVNVGQKKLTVPVEIADLPLP